MPSEFEIDIDKFIKKAGKQADRFLLEFTQDLAESVVMKTPVDTGFLRSSWTARLNEPDQAVTGITGSESQATQHSMNKISLNLSNVKGGDIIYISNNANYAAYVEFGTSQFAGRNFVRSTVSNADTIAREALKKVIK